MASVDALCLDQMQADLRLGKLVRLANCQGGGVVHDGAGRDVVAGQDGRGWGPPPHPEQDRVEAHALTQTCLHIMYTMHVLRK